MTTRITPAPSRSLTALEKAYASAYREALSTPSRSLARHRVEADGLVRTIGVEVPGIGCFTASPRDWQAVILLNALEGALVGRSSIVSAKVALQQIRERGWLRPRFSRLPPAEAKALSAALSSYASPADAITAWAMTLSREGILVPSSARGQWMIRRETLQRVREARQQKEARPSSRSGPADPT